jgi:hypothetical protein
MQNKQKTIKNLKTIAFVVLGLLILTGITMGNFSFLDTRNTGLRSTEEGRAVFVVSAIDGSNEVNVAKISFLNSTKGELSLTTSGATADKLQVVWDEMIKKPSLQYKFEKIEGFIYRKKVMYMKITKPEDNDYYRGVFEYFGGKGFYLRKVEDIVIKKLSEEITKIMPENWSLEVQENTIKIVKKEAVYFNFVNAALGDPGRKNNYSILVNFEDKWSDEKIKETEDYNFKIEKEANKLSGKSPFEKIHELKKFPDFTVGNYSVFVLAGNGWTAGISPESAAKEIYDFSNKLEELLKSYE